jgi:hypothetical protein
MAVLLSADGSSRVLTPAKGAAFTLTELQTIVGGYIETVGLADGRVLVINENGKDAQLRVNRTATVWLHVSGGHPDDYVVGEAVVATRQELGE